MRVSEAIQARRSIRAYANKPVALEMVRDILDRARRAPSGGNLQPWVVHVVSGRALNDLRNVIASKPDLDGREARYPFYPPGLWEPYRSRRQDAGRARYARLGVEEKSEGGRFDLLRRNYRFFGAPVGLFLCMDRRMGPAQWADLGMFMQCVMLLATERGLDTCPQAIWINFSKTVGQFLGLADTIEVVAGMAMGYRDESNELCEVPTERAELEELVTFHGFAVEESDVG